jgi:hypothetical protein
VSTYFPRLYYLYFQALKKEHSIERRDQAILRCSQSGDYPLNLQATPAPTHSHSTPSLPPTNPITPQEWCHRLPSTIQHCPIISYNTACASSPVIFFTAPFTKLINLLWLLLPSSSLPAQVSLFTILPPISSLLSWHPSPSTPPPTIATIKPPANAPTQCASTLFKASPSPAWKGP